MNEDLNVLLHITPLCSVNINIINPALFLNLIQDVASRNKLLIVNAAARI